MKRATASMRILVASPEANEGGQPWTATTWSLNSLREWGLDARGRVALKLAEHVPDMLRYRRHAEEADVVHWQWLTVQPLDVHLLAPKRPRRLPKAARRRRRRTRPQASTPGIARRVWSSSS